MSTPTYYRLSTKGFDKLSRIPALLVSGCEEPQVEEAKSLAEAVMGMAKPVLNSDTFGPPGTDVSKNPPVALHVESMCQTALHVGATAPQPEQELTTLGASAPCCICGAPDSMGYCGCHGEPVDPGALAPDEYAAWRREQEQAQQAIAAGGSSRYLWLDRAQAEKAWEHPELEWQEAESSELRVQYAYAGGLEYRASLCERGELEYVQVRCDPRLLAAEREAHAATRAELAARDKALAEAEARLEDAENGYQRLWDALWDVRERCERGEGCTPNLLIEVINNMQQAELDSSKWPSKTPATAQEVQE